MTKYFAKGTRLAELERMMMTVPRFRQGGGMMVFCRFHSCSEDVACKYCQEYSKRICGCPFISGQLNAAVGYRELVRERFSAMDSGLKRRVEKLAAQQSLPIALNRDHQRRMWEHQIAGPNATHCPRWLAVLYLLTSRDDIWDQTRHAVSQDGINFCGISLRGIDPQDYPIYKAAKSLYIGQLLITTEEMADKELISDAALGDILNAVLVFQYGQAVLDAAPGHCAVHG